MERLRWRIIKDLKLSPSDPIAKCDNYEQLTWVWANIQIDREEYEDRLCDKCKSNSNKILCPCCGDEIKESIKPVFNPNFDINKFKQLAGEEDV